MGQRLAMSTHDVERVQKLYGCTVGESWRFCRALRPLLRLPDVLCSLCTSAYVRTGSEAVLFGVSCRLCRAFVTVAYTFLT